MNAIVNAGLPTALLEPTACRYASEYHPFGVKHRLAVPLGRGHARRRTPYGIIDDAASGFALRLLESCQIEVIQLGWRQSGPAKNSCCR
jgi:hypothetical protein